MGDAVLEAIERDEAYRVVSVLSDGPSGRTELVVPVATGTPIYVRKRIPIQIANPEAWEQLAAISHPLLPHVAETYLLPDAFVTVCDYVEGFSVEQLMAARGRIDADQVRAIIADVCSAAGALHARGIIHRDITPKNVIIAADGAHLIDLGIARVGDATARHDTTRLGTWGFAAPEQFGFAQTDARSDVYSIGTLAGYMLTGTDPGEYGFDVAVSNLPWNLSSVIERARSFEPSARFASARELSQAFGEGAPVQRASLATRLRMAMSRGISLADAFRVSSAGRKVLAVVVSLLVLLMAGSGFDAALQRWPSIDLRERIGTLLLAIAYAGFFVGCAYHCACAFVGARGYAAERHRVKRYFINVGLMFLAMVAVMVIIALIFGTSSTGRNSAGS